MHYCVHGTNLRHFYAISLGILIQLYMFGTEIVHVFIMSSIVYLMMIVLPRKTQAKYVMFFVLCYLSGQHVVRMIANFGGFELDITTFTMLHICKLSALAFCYKDGAEDPEKLTEEQKKWKVIHLPGLLEFASYTFFVNSCALGIFFEFSDYKKFVEKTQEFTHVPCPIIPSLKWLIKGLACMGVFIAVQPYFYLPDCWSEVYATYSYWYKLVFYFIAMSFKRFFYYGPFSITTGAIIASGLGYKGKDKEGHDKWDRIIQVYIWEIETGKSPVELLRFWNTQVHLWLKYYVGGRLVEKGERASAA